MHRCRAPRRGQRREEEARPDGATTAPELESRPTQSEAATPPNPSPSWPRTTDACENDDHDSKEDKTQKGQRDETHPRTGPSQRSLAWVEERPDRGADARAGDAARKDRDRILQQRRRNGGQQHPPSEIATRTADFPTSWLITPAQPAKPSKRDRSTTTGLCHL